MPLSLYRDIQKRLQPYQFDPIFLSKGPEGPSDSNGANKISIFHVYQKLFEKNQGSGESEQTLVLHILVLHVWLLENGEFYSYLESLLNGYYQKDRGKAINFC